MSIIPELKKNTHNKNHAIQQILESSSRTTVLLGSDQMKRCFQTNLGWEKLEGVELRIGFFWILQVLQRGKEFKNNSSQGFSSSSKIRQ